MEQLQTDFLISPNGLFVFCIACFEPIVLKFIALSLQALTGAMLLIILVLANEGNYLCPLQFMLNFCGLYCLFVLPSVR